METHSSIPACESHGRRSLAGYSPWGGKELDTTERLHFSLYKVPQVGHLNNRNVTSHGSGGWKPTIKVSVGLVSQVGCKNLLRARAKSWGCQPLSPFGCMSCMETGHLLHIKV